MVALRNFFFFWSGLITFLSFHFIVLALIWIWKLPIVLFFVSHRLHWYACLGIWVKYFWFNWAIGDIRRFFRWFLKLFINRYVELALSCCLGCVWLLNKNSLKCFVISHKITKFISKRCDYYVCQYDIEQLSSS